MPGPSSTSNDGAEVEGESIGEEGEYGVEETEGVEEAAESVLTEYDPEDFFSGAVVSPESTIPDNIFDFEHSYSYDCKKYYNLCACDETVVAWCSGSMITFYNIKTKNLWFRRSTTGGTVGCIAAYREEPNYRIAVAEAAEGSREPIILMYFWPQMDIDAVLRDGTTNAYSILDFSPDGELLASVGKEPDYNITIWTWKRHSILLRTSAFTFDVYNVFFSPYVPGQLTTGGAAHIKFWKMAATFTGLKLEGELGRFGKTEICDVIGVYPMPDEKVLSGSEWGNILVWEAGLVKVEVTQRGRKRCHGGAIVQFLRSSDGYEITSISKDGCIRTWYWDTVEQADPPEDDQFVELNPVAETCVPGASIMCIRLQKGFNWFAQDSNGGLWIVDMELDKLECDHRKVYTCHAGSVVALVCMRHHPLVISFGEDGAVHVYHVEEKALLLRYCFPSPVKCVFYPPLEVDITSQIVLIGFNDGMMRMIHVDAELLMEKPSGLVEIHVDSALTISSIDMEHPKYIKLISLLKPHSAGISQISLNHQHTLLVTAGEDSTLFMYGVNRTVKPFALTRLGFIETPNNISYMAWKPDEERVLLLCGQVGLMLEVVLPDAKERPYEEITTFKLQFQSFKETLLRKFFLRYKPFPEESDLASLDEEALKRQGEANDDDEEDEWRGEIELVISESQLGTRITWAEYTDSGRVWCVQAGTGALLLITPGGKDIIKYGPIPGAWCDDITEIQFVCDKKYLVIGTGNGYIRMLRMLTEEEDNEEVYTLRNMLAFQKLMKKLKGRRLAKPEPDPIPRLDFEDNYYLPMHDRYTGAVTSIVFTGDGKRMLSSGRDGNIFSYFVNFSEPLKPPLKSIHPGATPAYKQVREPSSADGPMLSHELLKQKEEYDKMMAIANAHKKRVRDQLATLTNQYIKLIRANRQLPVSQQIDVTLDQRPLDDLEREIDEAKALVHRQWAHQLEASDLRLAKMYNRNIICLDFFPFTLSGIRDPTIVIKPIRQKNLSADFFDQLNEVYRKMAEAALKQKRSGSVMHRAAIKKVAWGGPRAASFLLSLPADPPYPLKKALKNYYTRLHRHYNQQVEWQEHISLKPDPNAMPPGAADALREAEASIGNYLLKTEPDYIAKPGHNTQLRLCMVRKEIYDTKHDFNLKVVAWREEKLRLVARMQEIGAKLTEIRAEVPPALARPAPAIPPIDEDMEFPEKHLEVNVTVSNKQQAVKMVKQKGEKRKTVAQARVRAPRVPRFVEIIEKRPLLAVWELISGKDATLTENELEIKQRRIHRRLYEQDMLIAEAESSVIEFDNYLLNLQRERIRVLERNQLLELHLYQLHREMIVLNRFESHEDNLSEKVYDKLMQVATVQEQIAACERSVLDRLAEKEVLLAACAEIQRVFKRLVNENKFFDFLRRIFKKKYRPPRDKDPDESSESESSSSSSEEEEDEGSVDSRDIGPIRLDPNICPEGCDRDLYDQTYALRNTRHQHEQDIREQERLVELLKKDIEAHHRVLRKLENQLDRRKQNLREFMMEKQSCLNEIEMPVLLRYDQIRANALAGCDGPLGLKNALVFPETLLAKLRRRVLELQQEIRDQKSRHRTNRIHLHRMEVDLRHMASMEDDIRARMRVVITRKLGKVRNVDKTLDGLLKQMTRRFKFQVSDAVNADMYKQIRHWRKRHSDLEQTYMKTICKYTERLRVAAALQSETNPQKEQRELNRYFGSYSPAQYQRDVVRLRIIRKQQLEHIKVLQKEIRQLKTKPLVPLEFLDCEPPISAEGSTFSLFKFAPIKDRVRFPYFPLGDTPSRTASEMDEAAKQAAARLLGLSGALGFPQDECLGIATSLGDMVKSMMDGKSSRFEVGEDILKMLLDKIGREDIDLDLLFDLRNLVDGVIDNVLSYEPGEHPLSAGRGVNLEAIEGALGQISETEDLETMIKNMLDSVINLLSIEDIESESTDIIASIVSALLLNLGIPSLEDLEGLGSKLENLLGDDGTDGSAAARARGNLLAGILDSLTEEARDGLGGMKEALDEFGRPISPLHDTSDGAGWPGDKRGKSSTSEGSDEDKPRERLYLGPSTTRKYCPMSQKVHSKSCPCAPKNFKGGKAECICKPKK